MIGDNFVIIKHEGCALQIKVARDQENIYHLNVAQIKYTDYLIYSCSCEQVFKFVSFLLYQIEVKMHKCAMLRAYTVSLRLRKTDIVGLLLL